MDSNSIHSVFSVMGKNRNRRSQQERYRRRRKALFEKDPTCPDCNRKMILYDYKAADPKERPPDNAATIDHLDSRLSGRRRHWHGRYHGTERTQLVCIKCNQARARAEEIALGVEELRIRSNKDSKESDA